MRHGSCQRTLGVLCHKAFRFLPAAQRPTFRLLHKLTCENGFFPPVPPPLEHAAGFSSPQHPALHADFVDMVAQAVRWCANRSDSATLAGRVLAHACALGCVAFAHTGARGGGAAAVLVVSAQPPCPAFVVRCVGLSFRASSA